MSRRRKLSRKPKTIRNNPKRYFYDLEYVGDNWLLFDEEMQMWVDYDNTVGLATTSVLCNTLKAAIHHLKKHKEGITCNVDVIYSSSSSSSSSTQSSVHSHSVALPLLFSLLFSKVTFVKLEQA